MIAFILTSTNCGFQLKNLLIKLVQKYDHEYPEKDIKNFIDYVGISRENFDEVIEFYHTQSPNIWKKVNNKWKLRHTLLNNGTDDSPYPKNK